MSEQTPTPHERYEQLAHYLTAAMVPDEVAPQIKVSSKVSSGELRVVVNVPELYRGVVIGRSGHMVRSLRAVMQAAAIPTDLPVELDIE